MTDRHPIEWFLLRSGFAPQSIAALRPDFPRWERRMRAEGFSHIPDTPWARNDDRAASFLCMLIAQASPGQTSTHKHELRNLTGIRPYKL